MSVVSGQLPGATSSKGAVGFSERTGRRAECLLWCPVVVARVGSSDGLQCPVPAATATPPCLLRELRDSPRTLPSARPGVFHPRVQGGTRLSRSTARVLALGQPRAAPCRSGQRYRAQGLGLPCPSLKGHSDFQQVLSSEHMSPRQQGNAEIKAHSSHCGPPNTASVGCPHGRSGSPQGRVPGPWPGRRRSPGGPWDALCSP